MGVARGNIKTTLVIDGEQAYYQIQAYEHNTGVSLKKKISKKILTFANGKGIVNYEVNA